MNRPPRVLPAPPYRTVSDCTEGTEGYHLMYAATHNQTLREAAQLCLNDWRNPAKDLDRTTRTLIRSLKRLQHKGIGIRLDTATNRLWLTEDGKTRWLPPDVADAEDQAHALAERARRYFKLTEVGDLPAALEGIVADAVSTGREAHPTLTQEQEGLVRRMTQGLAVMMCEWFARGETLEAEPTDEKEHDEDTKEAETCNDN